MQANSSITIVVAPDSFKESASARQIAEWMAEGVRRVLSDAEVILLPIADGGEGTVEAIVTACKGKICTNTVTGPLGKPVTAQWGLINDGKTAVIELAAASGLTLIPPAQRDPRFTTTKGVGELIRLALDAKVERIIIGLGGSGTNDAGCGMAQALGYILRDEEGKELPIGGIYLTRLSSIDSTQVDSRLFDTEILVACDVTNPLYGPQGAAQVYAPQKGATPEIVVELDEGLRRFAEVVRRYLGKEVSHIPGAGAAGGMGAGLLAFTNATLVSGFTLIANICRLEEHIRGASLVLTGEGCIDHQTAYGKTISGIIELAQKYNTPVVAFAGKLGLGYQSLYPRGLTAAFALADGPMTFEESLERVAHLLPDRVESVVRLWTLKNQREKQG